MKIRFVLFVALVVQAVGPGLALSLASDSCDRPDDPIACENSRPGAPSAEWDLATAAGDESIQGFATQISVNAGERIDFKVETTASTYRIDLYRLGFYRGDGARKVDTVKPSAPLPQTQPDCLTDDATGLVDCGNWAVSASWSVPPDAVSGIYLARLTRPDTGGASHIVFIVRNDDRRSDLLVQTPDTAWAAYNAYGGNSLYRGAPAGRAFKVSYNRPNTVRGGEFTRTSLFDDVIPMVRFLEGNGYDVTYTTGADVDARGSLLRQHKAFVSIGHDEYWSGAQRANVEAARDAGVNLAFFGGNDVFWKTRWETSMDASHTPYRTLVTYKESIGDVRLDPTGIWTGTWRDSRFSPPADGGRPENALMGTQFLLNCCNFAPLVVSAEEGRLRFWRGTGLDAMQGDSTAVAPGLVGYEVDVDPDNGARPAGQIRLSSTDLEGLVLGDHGDSYQPGKVTHHLTYHRAASGALVFGAGTVHWSWGLDATHDHDDIKPPPADRRIRQATVNLLADLGAQPATLQADLVAASPSSDHVPPTSTVTTPVAGTVLTAGTPVTITGEARDTGGRVGGVEVSTDGGATWHPATGRERWTYTFTPSTTGPADIRSRATDDSLNTEPSGSDASTAPSGSDASTAPSGSDASTAPSGSDANAAPSGSRLHAASAGGTCPCHLFDDDAVPALTDVVEGQPVTLGLKFSSDRAGEVTGVRAYTGATGTAAGLGQLWSATGQVLATARFTDATRSGWHEARFATPVAIRPDTTYVVSYYSPDGHYSATVGAFGSGGVDAAPLHVPGGDANGANGVFAYGADTFPATSYRDSNYWVDVTFR